jgi:hypothetical protein
MESCRIRAILSIWDCAGQEFGKDIGANIGQARAAATPQASPHP